MMNMVEDRGQVRLIFEIPTRGLLGYRGQFVIDTKGEGIISSRFIEFRPFAGTVEKQTYGSMIQCNEANVWLLLLIIFSNAAPLCRTRS
jgi:GTP-binding protein